MHVAHPIAATAQAKRSLPEHPDGPWRRALVGTALCAAVGSVTLILSASIYVPLTL
jgi:hypothetical protein